MINEKLQQKLIKFHEDELLGIKDENGKLWLGVNKTCQSLGFDVTDSKNQVTKINKDEVLKMNSLNFQTVQKEGNREVQRDALFISEKGVPLWLAKINVTDKMKTKYPKLSEKLIKYQMEVAEVLHESFFATEEQKEQFTDNFELKGKIEKLENEISCLKEEIKVNTNESVNTQNRLNTLIDNSTINSRQASKLLIHAKDRVNCLLGGANSKEYKKNSRTYFKNLWLAVCEQFETNSYKDLNPLNFNDAVTFVSGWSYR